MLDHPIRENPQPARSGFSGRSSCAGGRYVQLRRFAPAFLEAFDFDAPAAGRSLQAAVELLRELNRSGGAARRDLRAQLPRIAGHESTRTTQLYNRVQDEISLDEIERIHI